MERLTHVGARATLGTPKLLGPSRGNPGTNSRVLTSAAAGALGRDFEIDLAGNGGIGVPTNRGPNFEMTVCQVGV